MFAALPVLAVIMRLLAGPDEPDNTFTYESGGEEQDRPGTGDRPPEHARTRTLLPV